MKLVWLIWKQIRTWLFALSTKAAPLAIGFDKGAPAFSLVCPAFTTVHWRNGVIYSSGPQVQLLFCLFVLLGHPTFSFEKRGYLCISHPPVFFVNVVCFEVLWEMQNCYQTEDVKWARRLIPCFNWARWGTSLVFAALRVKNNQNQYFHLS